MFTRIAKGILIFLMIIVVIFALLVATTTDAGFLGFLCVIIVGGIGLFFFGIYVELANNIMDIRESLVKDEKEGLHQHVVKEESVEIVDGKWICKKCGTKNELNTTWCTFCGKQTRGL